MKTRFTLLRVTLALVLLFVFSNAAISQKIASVKKVTDYTSIAKVTAYTDGVNISYTNPYTNSTQSSFAGAFDGTLNSQSKKFYCIDLAHNLGINEDYWDEGITPSQITYILNNYYPYKISYTGKLTDNKEEAASVQAAIWYFSDGVDANTINNTTIRNRALQIIADANANHNNVIPVQTIQIIPTSQNLPQGTLAAFKVKAVDLNGNPVSGVTVNLTATLGTLSNSSVTTGTNGESGTITLSYSGIGVSTISAKASIIIPQGTRYVHKTNPSTKQKLVLATPATDVKEAGSTITWYDNTVVVRTIEKDLCAKNKVNQEYTVGKLITEVLSSGNVKVKLIVSKDLNDNTYGTNTVNWPGNNHTFNHLLKSDRANFVFKNGNGTTVLDFTLDYLYESSSFPSGYGVASVTAGEGSITVGSATKILNVNTSLNRNLNEFGYVLTTNSPATNSSYAPNPNYPNWIYEMIYEVTIDASAFGASGFGDVLIPSMHHSPNKLNFDNAVLTYTCTSPASIGDKVWEDTNKNGIQDSGENGIANVTVKLFDCNNNLIATTTTNSSGNYSFTNLTPGDYYVQFIAPSGYTLTAKDQGTDDTKDSDADATTGKTICTTLSAGENDLTWDAGMYPDCKNKIGNFVWHDKNVNGIQESGEPGLAGVLVELLQGTSVISSTTTDTNGKYEFTNLPNGTYSVRIASSNYLSGGVLYSTSQTKWYATKKNQGIDDTKDSDANKNESVSVTLNCNDDITIDFGFYKTCIKLTKTADKQTAEPGNVINYTLTTENCGDVQFHGGVDLIDAMLGINMNFVLNPGETKVVTKAYTVKDTDCGNLVNNASATGHPVDGSANVVDNATFIVVINCQQKSDLKVEKTVDNSNPNCNDFVNYTIKVTNLGPNTAANVVVNDLLPAGLIFDSYTASQGTYNNTTGVWSVGSLTNNSFATLTIKVKIECSTLNNTTFDLGPAKEFNLFVLENLNQPSSDTEGKVAVGNNANLSAYSIGDKLAPNSGDVFIVGNDLTFTSGQVFNGNVVYGNNTNLPQYSVSISGGSLRKDNVIDFVAAKNYLQSLSTTLGGYTVNGTTTFQWGGLTLTGLDPFLNVFSVNGSDLSSANSVTINVPNGSVVLVNINGTTVSWTGGLVVNGTAITNVLYNFYQATNLTIQGIDVRGTLLAPFADLNFPAGLITGQVIVKSMSGSGQINLSLFGGNIPVDKVITNIASVTSSLTDPNAANNSSSVTITIGSTNSGSGSGTGTGTGTGSGAGTGTGSGTGSWTTVCSFGQGEIIYTIYADGSTLYAGTMGGKIYKSTNGGQTWTLINSGMNVNLIWAFTKHNDAIYAATENGVYMFNGSAWNLAGLSGKDVHTLLSKNGILYAGTWGYGIFKSSDNGASWSEFNNGLDGFLTIQALTAYNSTIFAGTVGGGLYKSTNGGVWTKALCGYQLVWSLASKSGVIFAGTYGDGIYISTDGGNNFTKLASSPVAFVYSIAIDGSGKVYVSSVANGVYVSADNGNTWTAVGLGGYNVSSLVVDPNSSNVYAGTKAGQMFKIYGNQNTTGVDDISGLPTEFNLSQNYPNPFNPTTTIEFSIKEAGNYSLKVYDMLGQEVATLINNSINAGTYKVAFDASKLSSGIYIYRLSGNNINLTKKMILTK